MCSIALVSIASSALSCSTYASTYRYIVMLIYAGHHDLAVDQAGMLYALNQ